MNSFERSPLRVAVIGAGRMGRHHARIYGQLPDSQLMAVVDKDYGRAQDAANTFGGTALTRADDLPEVDAVSVAVPTVYHAEVAIPLMQRGIPVLIEKPLAPDTRAAWQLLEASRHNRCVLQVGHSERFNPVVQAMLRMEVKPRFIETQRVSPFTFRSADIGVVFDMMIHDIDIVLHLTQTLNRSTSPSTTDDRSFAEGQSDSFMPGPSYALDAIGVNVLGETEDVANARVRFAGGTVANLTASRLALKTERRIRVFCPTAYLTMDYQKKSGIAVKLSDNLDLIRMARERNFEDLSQMASLDFGSMVKIEPLTVADVEPLRAEIEAFLQAVRAAPASRRENVTSPTASSVWADEIGRVPPLRADLGVSAEEGYAAVEMAERITEAVRSQGLEVRS